MGVMTYVGPFPGDFFGVSWCQCGSIFHLPFKKTAQNLQKCTFKLHSEKEMVIFFQF